MCCVSSFYSHKLDSLLLEVFLKLGANEIGRTGYTTLPETGAVTANTAEPITSKEIMIMKTIGNQTTYLDWPTAILEHFYPLAQSEE